MPELPEVETIRRGLARLGWPRRVRSVTVLDPRSLRRHPGGPEDFAQTLTGTLLHTPRRRGKFLWLPADTVPADAGTPRPGTPTGRQPSVGAPRADAAPAPGGSTACLLAHLGMSGQLLSDAPPHRHDRIRITLGPVEGASEPTVDETGDDLPSSPAVGPAESSPGTTRVVATGASVVQTVTLVFRDQRLFGSLAIDTLQADAFRLRTGPHTIPAQVAHIAPDPLEPGARPAGPGRPAAQAPLGDQAGAARPDGRQRHRQHLRRRVAVGGPGASRAAGRHPGPRVAVRLMRAVAEVMRRAITAGGTSIDEQYRHVNGASGWFDVELAAYGRTGRPCPRCGTPIRRGAFLNRSSHWCPRCQRLRRPAREQAGRHRTSRTREETTA
jgi:formamidopyrimidine-DNA glycosylase